MSVATGALHHRQYVRISGAEVEHADFGRLLPDDGLETFLKDAGFDALHWRKVGAADAADDQIVEWAANNDAIVLTKISTLGPSLQRRA
ncbi:MAG: DUF5615 family PIN-like protein [Planctomycetes bacterium]|nr:DUF5615 family PIN-like protein [Planctomycetota bacterium]